nr:helix-turn-helix domain-containing protein [Nocardioidaceae bacterium]
MSRANANVERRAQLHAAVGEPMRLAIVDWLMVGDAAPRELSDHFGVATNLLAHHLRVLEEAGLIRRTRSEGDRRRTYVRFCLEDPTVRAVLGGCLPQSDVVRRRPPSRVVFVCTQNSARSQLAHAAWGLLSSVPSASAGTHPAIRVHPRAIAIGRRHNLPLSDAHTSYVRDVLRRGDLVVAVCDQAHEELGALESAEPGVRLHWSVPDPVRIGTNAAFENAYRDIADRVERLVSIVATTSRQVTASDTESPTL